MSPDDLPVQTQLQAGSTTFNGPRQFWTPPPLIFGTNSGSGTATGERTNIRLQLPSSQVRAKLSLIFIPSNGPAFNIQGAGTIWLAAMEQDQKGISGGGGGFFPVNDLDTSTAAAPLPFPTSSGLTGYSREFVTAADAIQAQVTLDSIGGGAASRGIWVAQARVEPFAVLMPPEMWEQIRRLVTLENLGPRLVL